VGGMRYRGRQQGRRCYRPHGCREAAALRGAAPAGCRCRATPARAGRSGGVGDAAVGVGTAGCPAARSSLPRSSATGAPRSGRVRSVYGGRWLERRHYAGRAPSASAGRDAENQGGHMQSTGQPNRDGARPSARHLARAWPDPLNGLPPSVAATSLPPNLYTYRSALACSDTALVS
jgi:hypothetical protein